MVLVTMHILTRTRGCKMGLLGKKAKTKNKKVKELEILASASTWKEDLITAPISCYWLFFRYISLPETSAIISYTRHFLIINLNKITNKDAACYW